MGRTFAAYVTELRIASARQVLVESDQSIAEVRFASGFRTLSISTGSFAQLRGCRHASFDEGVPILKQETDLVARQAQYVRGLWLESTV